jgi:hypothetical protein
MTTSAWETVPRHPVAVAVERLGEVLDEVTEQSVWSMDHDEFKDSLTALTSLTARLAELQLRVAAGAERSGVGSEVAATSTASWWAGASRLTRAAAHRSMRLAKALDGPHERVGDALAAGDLLLDQASVIVDAVDALPDDLVDRELAQQAETHLIRLAREHDAKALKILGRRILDVLAPEIAEAHEQRQLDEEEREASAKARFTLTDDGHGRSHGRFTIPTAQAEMLRKHLLALAAPRHRNATGGNTHEATAGLTPGERTPLPHRLGLAFCEYVERYPAGKIPDAGGVSATVVVTMDLDTLMGGLGVAQLDTGAVITAGQARRLACEAGIIPVVLGGKSQVLDLGRRKRFHNKAQRIALALTQGGCTAEGCDWPPGLCHVHHEIPWWEGGPTDLEHGRLLCPHHHARVHDSRYRTEARPHGKLAFIRRT